MYENRILTLLKQKRHVYGFSVNFPNPVMLECITDGWDFVWLDAQHGFLDYKDLLQCSIACRASGISTVIRVPGHEFSVTGPAADLCPDAIMLPMVNSVHEAEQIARNLHFAPNGTRSFWNARMIKLAGNAYDQGRGPLVIAQIESVNALDQAEGIISTDGIDVLMLGAADLSLSMGIRPGTSRENCDALRNAYETVIRAAQSVGKYSMFIAGDPTDARKLEEMGADIIVCGSDYQFLADSAQKLIRELKGTGISS